MNVNKLNNTKEAVIKTTGMLKPTTEITKIICNEYFRELELNEYCKIVESDFTKSQKKFQALMAGKNQSARVKTEYKSRNKINITNSESLLKALNELYKYKCELKSSYVATEKALKFKKLRYKKIIVGYESAWNEALEKCNKTPIAAELLKIQQENQVLEKEIEKQAKLTTCTKIQFTKLKENIGQDFSKKVVQFSKFMTQYTNFLISQKRNAENQTSKAQIMPRTLGFKFFKEETPFLTEKSSYVIDSNDDPNVFSSIDVTVFDDIIIPSENLESQHLEEDSYSFLQNEMQRVSDTSKDRVDGLEYLSDHQETVEPKDKRLLKILKEYPMQNNAKTPVAEENESHYFQQQPVEYSKKSHADNPQGVESRTEVNNKQGNTEEKFNENVEKLKSLNSGRVFALPQAESEDEALRDIQMECEESLSEGSYEKQYSVQREVYDRQKTSSVSSEDLPPSGENPNESVGSFRKPSEDQNKNFKPRSEIQRDDYKSFTGFFTIGNDNDNPTPSIFKLF